MAEEYIKFSNVVKSYGTGNAEIHALDGVDSEVNKGEFCILLGSSAAGKTTLLDMLGGMDTITSGKIRSNEINANVVRKELNICQL